MSADRRVDAFLRLAVADLDAAEVLARIGNHYAAYHLQQAVEKLEKALLLRRGIEAGIEHRLELLAARLPPGDAWHERLEEFLEYSAYGTSFRYPMPGGAIPHEPPATEVLTDVVTLRALVGLARAEPSGPTKRQA